MDYRNMLRYSLEVRVNTNLHHQIGVQNYTEQDVKKAISRLSKSPQGPQDAQISQSPGFVMKIRMLAARQPELGLRQRFPLSPTEQDRMVISTFEEDLWKIFQLDGVLVPEVLLKECQKRLREEQSQFPPTPNFPSFLQTSLEILSDAHRERKVSLVFYNSPSRMGDWKSLKSTPPSDDMKKLGPRFWALIIGNDEYAAHRLRGCVNDANLIRNYIKNHLGVTDDHIRFLPNASRSTIVNSLYDLRDDWRILRGDNILIHFSGHGTSYEAGQYFTGPIAAEGSIEAICPIDRGPSVPDISDRELNSILLEVLAEKGQNITVILDCCHAGGSLRNHQHQGPDYATRYLHPQRTENNMDLQLMLNAGDHNIRRGRYTPSISSEIWDGYFDGIVQLASCHDFQVAREADYHHSNDPSHPTARVNVSFNSNALQEPELPNAFSSFVPRGPMFPSVSGPKLKPRPQMSHSPSALPPSHFPSASMPPPAHSLSHYSPHVPPTALWQPQFPAPAPPPYYNPPQIQHSPPRYGCFTWALVKVLESEIGKNGTYESVIASIGKLSVAQEPVLLGRRKVSRLWFREYI